MFKKLAALGGAVLLAAQANAAADAAVLIAIEDAAEGVTVTISGDIDTRGLRVFGTTERTREGFIARTPGIDEIGLVNGDLSTRLETNSDDFTLLPTFLRGTDFAATSSFSGDTFVFEGGSFLVDADYESGDPIAATFAFAGETFASLGIIAAFEGTQLLSNGDTITIFTGMGSVDAVPLPSAAALFVPALAGGLIARRRAKGAGARG